MKFTVYLYWRVTERSEKGGQFMVCNSNNYEKLWPNEYTLLGAQEIEFTEVLSVDPRERAINALKAEKATLIKEATQRAEKIEEKIQQLLAITSQTEVAA